MNHKFTSILLTVFLSKTAFADVPTADFAKYATPAQTMNCKTLDYSSYHKTDTVKGNLIKTNPDLKHPNFAGKYLLLRNDYLFDTVWFVADCATGKFFKDSLSTDHKKPVTDFNAGSSLVSVHSSDSNSEIALQYHVFQNEKWMRVEVPSAAPVSAATTVIKLPSSTTNTGTAEPLFSDFPATLTDTCKPLDFNSNSRAQSYKGNLLKEKPDLSHPNFAGHFYVLRGETFAQTYWLIADCNTGKFFPEMLTGDATFQRDSQLFKVFNSGKFATYYLWNTDDSQWIKLHANNSVYGKTAKTFFDALPNPSKLSSIRFENLKCMNDHCEVDLGKDKAMPITGVAANTLNALIAIWGKDHSIKSGKCKNDNHRIICDLEN